MKTEILQRDAKILREKAQAVPIKDIASKKIQNVIERMKKALHAEEDGVAIAAPQIGESLRMFVVNGEIFGTGDTVFINPELIKVSKKKRKMEEGCLSIRWLYGEVLRSEKVTVKAYNESGKLFQRGASGLLAQIFQHETDHLEGILFTDKAKHVEDIPPSLQPKSKIKFVFFGSLPAGKAGSSFSTYVLQELKKDGLTPSLIIDSAKDVLPSVEKLRKVSADVFIVASFGKILPKEIIDLPKHGAINVHPSLLPELRGPSPIQNTILGQGKPSVSIMKIDEGMDSGPIIAQEKISIDPWPDHYSVVEEKLGVAGGKLLADVLPKWILGEINAKPQDEKQATFTKLIKKTDGLLNMDDSAPTLAVGAPTPKGVGAEENLRKVLAYSTWPGAYMMFTKKSGEEVRIIVKEAEIMDGQFVPTRVIPAGKREMDWQDFLRGN